MGSAAAWASGSGFSPPTPRTSSVITVSSQRRIVDPLWHRRGILGFLGVQLYRPRSEEIPSIGVPRFDRECQLSRHPLLPPLVGDGHLDLDRNYLEELGAGFVHRRLHQFSDLFGDVFFALDDELVVDAVYELSVQAL